MGPFGLKLGPNEAESIPGPIGSPPGPKRAHFGPKKLKFDQNPKIPKISEIWTLVCDHEGASLQGAGEEWSCVLLDLEELHVVAMVPVSLLILVQMLMSKGQNVMTRCNQMLHSAFFFDFWVRIEGPIEGPV